jgi:hypothetical protein
MTSPSPEADEVVAMLSVVYRVLLRLSGRMPDDWMTEARTWFARGELADLPGLILGGVAGTGVALLHEDLDLLSFVHAEYGGPDEPAGIEPLVVADELPPTRHRFAAASEPDELDSAVLGNLDPVVVAVARASRTAPDGDTPTRVYLVEVDPDTEAWTVGDDLAELLGRSPERPVPQVEVYRTEEPLPPYHAAALAAATPLWRRELDPDPEQGPILVQRLVDAALRRDHDVMRRCIDWPLTGAPRTASVLAELPPAERDDWAGDMIPRLYTAGDTVEGVFNVLSQVVILIGDDPRSYRSDDAEAAEILERLRIPPVPGLAEPFAARLAELARRAEALSEVFLVHGGPTWLPLVWARDTNRLVLVFD